MARGQSHARSLSAHAHVDIHRTVINRKTVSAATAQIALADREIRRSIRDPGSRIVVRCRSCSLQELLHARISLRAA